jgi:cell division protein FtsL
MTPVPPATQFFGRAGAGLVDPELVDPELAELSGRPETREPVRPSGRALDGGGLGGPALGGPALDGPGLDGPGLDGLASDGLALDGVALEGQGPERQGPERHGKPEGQGTERHLQVVPRRGRRRASRRLVIYSLVACAVVVAFGLVSLHVMIAEAQFRLDHLQQEATAYQARYEKLQLQVALDEAPARIAELAIENGLQQPAAVTYLPAPAQPPGSGSRAGGARSGRGPTTPGPATSQGTVAAPVGTGNWPSLKPYLSATP